MQKLPIKIIKKPAQPVEQTPAELKKMLQSEMADIRRRFNSFVAGMEQKLNRMEEMFKK